MVQCTCKRLTWHSLSHSDSTHNLLNNFTLWISDKEIRKNFDDKRADNFRHLLVPVSIVVALVIIARFIVFFSNGTDITLNSFSRLISTVVFLIIWALLTCKYKQLAPLTIFITPFS